MTIDRALFLFDGPNFYKNLIASKLQRGHLDFYKLASNLALARQVVDVVLFTSPTDQRTDPINYANQQKFFTNVKSSGVTLKLGTLTWKKTECPQCNFISYVKVEKSVDVQIALDIVLRLDEFDTLYLASCDSDLIPAITFAKLQGKKVFMLLPDKAKGYAVSGACDATIPIKQKTLDAAQAV